jgi:ribosome maturation factor RimP
MDNTAKIAEIKDILGDFLRNENFVLVDIIYRYENGNLFLRILADKPQGGITLDECAQLNRIISQILDEKNILMEKYILEVSSPGLDRHLKSEQDFSRVLNKKVKIFLAEAVSGKIEWDGLVKEVNSSSLYLDTGKEVLDIALGNINKGKLLI